MKKSLLLTLGVFLVVYFLWDGAVLLSQSDIFPRPYQVFLGIVELIQHGLLLKYVVASLFRCTYICKFSPKLVVVNFTELILGLLIRGAGSCKHGNCKSYNSCTKVFVYLHKLSADSCTRTLLESCQILS